ncbi:hypothetical protein JDV02_009758 [Purpureocillium takamizusanense]|uniref:AAA+ ATPase domain-containing protein n=1 Tax=Purpureocillium takamizusanense TaxID=2060973 RepID=A0A9Q8VFU5_9HYPO|nr:uncharacterized protein JDV02_009758 [Purpureocillium takamizusanense]UNI23973.1 hypothetical protein JDV02_009758 [Purpureocillium takamizusanense]
MKPRNPYIWAFVFELFQADQAAEGVKSRVKVLVTRTDPETGEPIEEDGKLRKAKDKDLYKDYAFVLRKKVFEAKYPYPESNSSEIEIISLGLWNLLKERLGHWPYHTFRDAPVTLKSPFEPLVFHFDDLSGWAAEPPKDETDKQAREDLRILLETISGGLSGDERLDRYFKTRSNYKRQQPGTIQFEDLWTVFPPGTLVYGRPFQGEDQVFLVNDCLESWPWKESPYSGGRDLAPWKLYAWSYDWKDGSFRRTQFTLVFEKFDGHVPLTSLPFYPFELHEKHDIVRDKLIERGKEFRKICESKEDSRLFEYSGKAILEKKGFSGMKYDDDGYSSLYASPFFQELLYREFGPRRVSDSDAHPIKPSEVRSRVMVDYESYFQYGGTDGRNGSLKPGGGSSGCACPDCRSNVGLADKYRTRFDDGEFVRGKEWDPEQYLLCPPRVLGYVLQEKQWAQLQVSLLHRVDDWDEKGAWNLRLKLADDVVDSSKKRNDKKAEKISTKDLLLDLVRSHTSTMEHIGEVDEMLRVDDVIAGKGKGLVILLYGPPGVGKTLTAETIAIATKKPLFSVSVADVGTQAKHVESNLSRIFSLATKWQAILLIDEADVFLESRLKEGWATEKNALVSVFLRVLEYYEGIMFLTTNQIAEFDVAIPSRIHVAIEYRPLDTAQMEQIFRGFLEKLNRDRAIEDYDELFEWLEEVVYKEGFDGRQIRNIVTTALGLARANAKHRGQRAKLTKAHIKTVYANMSDFKRAFNNEMLKYKERQKKMIK